MQNRLIVLVGGTGTGKTYLIDKLLAEFPTQITRVKTHTTRDPRNEKDYDSYNFPGVRRFFQKVESGDIIEYDSVVSDCGQYYVGSSLSTIKSVLQHGHGVMALTPPGVVALHRLGVPISVFLLRPTRQAYKKNLSERGLRPFEQIQVMRINDAKFRLPQHIPHKVMRRTRRHEDLVNFIQEVSKIICQPQ